MKKNLFRPFLYLMFLGAFASPLAAQQVVSAGKIDILSGVSDVNFADAICQCDTITVEYEVKPNANFLATSTFEYQLASNPGLAFGAPTLLELTLLEKDDPPVALTLPSDTFSSGKKWASLVVPCNTPIGIYGLRIINRNSNGTITPVDGFSDTAFFQINRIPTIANIDSIALVRNQMRLDTVDNPYSSLPDIGLCLNDSLFLRVETNASAIQWYNGNFPIAGETKDSILVFGQGAYYAVVTNGGLCSINSDTINVSPIVTPTGITFDVGNVNNANAYVADNPIASNNTPQDSIELCIDQIALLNAPLPPPGSGLTYTYQWLTDSLNTVTGLRDWYPIQSATATQRTLQINSGIAVPGMNFFRVAIDDGFCQDTTLIGTPFHVIIDTVPNAVIAGIPFPGFAGPTVFNEICMKDSVLLTTIPSIADPNWKYQWQWFDTSVPPGANPWRSVSGGPLSFDTLTTIVIDTSLSDPGQPYFQTPKPEIRYFRVRIATETTFRGIETCFFTSDSVAVRWFPEYGLNIVNSPNAFIVGQDSVNFCETDSAILRAPATPASLISFGYTYSYQWLTDSLDPVNMNRVRYPILGETGQDYIVRSGGNYWVAIDDGICTDTSNVYRVFVDSLPSTLVQEIEFPGSGSGLTGLNLCLYDSALVSATDTVLGLAPWNYQWQQWDPINNVWTNLTNDTLVTFFIDTAYKRANEDTTWFRLATTYFNIFGLQTCATNTDSLMVIFYDSPDLAFFPGDSVGLCPGDSILFVAQGNFNSVSWDNQTILGPTRYINIPGQYTAEAVGVNGCITRDTIDVFALTVNAAAGPDQTIKSGQVATLTAFGGTNYRWYANKPIEFSDFLSQSIQVTKVLEDGVLADTVTVYVEVTNSRGCIGLDSLQLIINSNIPDQISAVNNSFNIFTPNGDGLNDLWDIRELMAGDNCKLTIMNRWGSVVYEDESFDGTWGGTDNGGNDLADGTYYYILDCGANNEIRMQNAITIIRNQQQN